MNRKMSAQFETFTRMIRNEPFLVLDTETTGLNAGEICSIAIVDSNGNTLLDTLVRTVKPIPQEAVNIHGITDAKVALAPTWEKTVMKVMDIIAGKNLVVYNAIYDRRMMHQSDEYHFPTSFDWKTIAKWFCAMEAYAEFWGDWNDYHNSYRWQRLSDGMAQQGLIITDAHSALGDCLATLALCKVMAVRESEEAATVDEILRDETLDYE
jgi:DNA polymerase-3 subunit epsilon